MSTNDNYEAGLKDASVALEVLVDRAFLAATALSISAIGEDAYDFQAHRTAVDRHSGLCAAMLEVYGLLNQHRRQRGAA